MNRVPQLPGTVKRPPAGRCGLVVGPGDHRDCFWHLDELEYRATGYELPSDLREGIQKVLDADFLVVLPGWEFDSQSNVMVTTAKSLGMAVLDCEKLSPVWIP